jgi:hypothetical protein
MTMEVYILVELLEDGRGGANEVVRGVFTDYQFANTFGVVNCVGTDYEIQDFDLDERKLGG